MKKAMMAVIGAVMAMMFSFAHAQVVSELYKAGSNSFSTAELRSVDWQAGEIKTIAQGGGLSSPGEYPDASKALYAKIYASADMQKYGILVPGTNRILNSRQFYRVTCNNGSTLIIWNWNNSETFTGDGCALKSTIDARATQ